MPIDVARVLDGGLDGLRRDLVEHHPLDGHGLRRAEHLEQVPGDGLPLAILVGCEIELVGLLHQSLQMAQMVALVAVDDVQRLEVVVDVDTDAGPGLALVGRGDLSGVARQITDVTDGGLDDVAVAEIARDGAGLGG